jgi:hypothetical protein
MLDAAMKGTTYRNLTLAVPAICATAILLAAAPFHWRDLALGPAYFLAFNLMEYALHRWLMHRPGTFLFDHVAIHHGLFNASHPYIADDSDNFRAVVPLYAAAAIEAGICLPAIPLWIYVSHHDAPFLAGCGFAYYFLNEIVHYGWHSGLWPAAARHHMRHHDIGGCNWNFSLPLFDWVFSTKR